MFDFEWANRSLFHGLYRRTQSFYDNSELGSSGRAADAKELAVLGEFSKSVEPTILDGSVSMPKSDGSGRNRKNQRLAIRLFKQAGYEIRDGIMVNTKTSTPFQFEFITSSRNQERLVLHFARTLKRIGIEGVGASSRFVSDATPAADL